MSNSNKDTKVERIHKDFYKELNEFNLGRRNNRLEEEDLSIKELTRMLPNCENWENVKKEMVTKRRKNE